MKRMLRFGLHFGIILIIASVSVCAVAEGTGAQPHLLTVLGLPGDPGGMAVNPANNHIYVAVTDWEGVASIDGSNETPEYLQVGSATTRDVAINAADNLIYVSRYETNDVLVIDGDSDEAVSLHALPGGCLPRGIDFDPNAEVIYAACSGRGTAVAIDTTLPPGEEVIESESWGSAPSALAVNPVTGLVYVADQESRVAVLQRDGESFHAVGTLHIVAWDLTVDGSRNLIYGASGSNSLWIIDGTSNAVGSIEIPSYLGYPPTVRAVAVNEVTNLIYVTSDQEGIFSVLYVVNGASNDVIGMGDSSMAGFAESVAFNPATTRIYAASPGNLYVFDDPDDDLDGVQDYPDDIDNCPLVWNEDQADADNDGIGDACDSSTDSDGDGVGDDVDNCPSDANAGQEDADGDGIGDACDDCLTYQGTDTPIGIADFNTSTSTIVVPDNFSIADVNVTLNIQHTFDADVIATLVSASGTPVELFRDIGGDGDNFTNTVLDDQCATAVADGAAPFTGCYWPQEPLAQLNGESSAGGWLLQVHDDNMGDQGSIVSWQVHLCEAAVADSDGDGVPDETDNCPSIANPGQEDADGDTLGDVCDPDIDGDGVDNGADNCQSVSNADQANSDGARRPNGPQITGEWASNPAHDASGLGDACDTDDDNDGTPDTSENELSCPYRTDADSDDDRVVDAYEVGQATNACDEASKPPPCVTSTDSDADGLTDCIERSGYNTCVSNGDAVPGWSACANASDSDSDGCADVLEVMDINGDRKVTIADQTLLAKRAVGMFPASESDPVFDVNKSGTITVGDQTLMAKNTCALKPGLIGCEGDQVCPAE
jgi:DNA-binding beta-propeller fold protein YncE/subtilisin-like proprotein convertase family protein